MRATLDFIKERFLHFNEICFGGRLPEVSMRISSSARTFGSLSHPRVFKGKPKASDFVLSVSDRFDLDRSVIEDTVIHEMIHLYIHYFGLSDVSAHGPVFRSIMGEINSRHGRNVTVSRRAAREERDTDRLVRPRLVLVTRFESGERTVTVCSPRCVASFMSVLGRIRNVTGAELYLASSPCFSALPVSRTLKLYTMDPQDLERGLAGARQVEIEGGKFRFADC